MNCSECNMPVVDSGLDRCFCKSEYEKQELDNLFDLAYEVFVMQKAQEALIRSFVVPKIDQILKPFLYLPMVKEPDELPESSDLPLPLGCWVQNKAQFYYSLTEGEWISQEILYPGDFPKNRFPNLPENLIKIPDGNI